MTPAAREQLRRRIAERLVEIEPMFDKRCRLTLIVRSPHLADGDIVTTNDEDLDAVVAALRRLATCEVVRG